MVNWSVNKITVTKRLWNKSLCWGFLEQQINNFKIKTLINIFHFVSVFHVVTNIIEQQAIVNKTLIIISLRLNKEEILRNPNKEIEKYIDLVETMDFHSKFSKLMECDFFCFVFICV